MKGLVNQGKPEQSKTVTPDAAGFTVSPDTGKTLSSVVVNGDSDLVATNIKSGVNIFGVTGNLASGYQYATGTYQCGTPAVKSISFSVGFQPTILIFSGINTSLAAYTTSGSSIDGLINMVVSDSRHISYSASFNMTATGCTVSYSTAVFYLAKFRWVALKPA